MINMNTTAGSSHSRRRSRSEILVSKKSIFDRIHCGVQRRRRENARGLLEDSAEDDPRQRRQNHIAPVGQGLRPIVQMRAAENESGGQQAAIVRAEALHDPVLNQSTKQDLFRQRGGAENYQIPERYPAPG